MHMIVTVLQGFTRVSCLIRHMNTIELQLEVTRFLQRCETTASAKSPQTAALKSPGSSSPPTLFGGSPMKVEIACRVRLTAPQPIHLSS